MTDEMLKYISSDELLNGYDYHFANHVSFTNSPEKNLMIAILLSTVIEYLYMEGEGFEDARVWFFDSIEEDWLFSFENICFTLGLPKKYFLDNLIKLRARPDRIEKAKRLKHLFPAPGNRRIIFSEPYQPKNKYDDFY